MTIRYSKHQHTVKHLLICLVCYFPGIAVSDYLDCPCKAVKITDGDTSHIASTGNLK